MSNRPQRSFAPREEIIEAAVIAPRSSFEFFTSARFSLKEQIFFTKRMAFLSRAGVPVLEALSIIKNQTKSPQKAKVYESLIADVANGQNLSASMAKFKYFLTDFGVNLVKVGESSGILEQNLTYLADELVKKDLLRKKVIGAMVYPIFITLATLGVTTLLTVYIFPKIMPIFTSLHVDLPLTTRILIAVSDYLRHWGLLTLLVILIALVAFILARMHFREFRYHTDNALFYIPLAGAIARSYNLANFCRTMGLMLRSGLQIAVAMEITAETTPNLVYQRAFAEVAACLRRGEPMSRELERREKLFPSILTHMIAVGEKTGSLSQTLSYLSEMYESEVDDQTKNLSSSIEPVLMIVMGLLVGLIAVSVITPIYGITQHLSPR
jgi:type II secretory pathway component PulF